MLKRMCVCLLVMVSACAVDAGTEGEKEQELGGSEAAAARTPGPRPEAGQLAAAFDSGKLAVRSCLAGAPVSAAGAIAELTTTGAATAQSCATYTGTCSGVNGCSRAFGGGWQFTACGSFLYAWMTICDGQPSG